MPEPIQIVAPSPFAIICRAADLGEWPDDQNPARWHRLHAWLRERYQARYIRMTDVDMLDYIIEFADARLATEFMLKYADARVE